MTAAERLAAARAAPLSTRVAVKDAWLTDYQGPLLRGPNSIPVWRIGGTPRLNVCLLLAARGPARIMCGARHLRLDLDLPCVRDHLVRCGMFAALRDDVPRALAWALTGGAVGSTIGLDPTTPNGAEATLRWLERAVGNVVVADDGWFLSLDDARVGWLPA